MASPHVCGIANLYLSMGLEPLEVADAIKSNAFSGSIVDANKDTLNLLACNTLSK